MTTLQEAAQHAIRALESWQRQYKEGTEYMDMTPARNALKDLRTALSQQELPQKERPDFMAGYDAGMADARRMAQQGAPATSDEWLANCPQEVRDFANKLKAAPQPAQECKPLCELCVKRGYNFCANVAQTTPITVQSAQPVAQQDHIPDAGEMVLSDDEILTIAHRKATRYTHAVAPRQVTYGFSVGHLLDFVRAVLEEKTAQPVAQPLPDPCHTCAHYQQGKLPGVRIHDETCYECRSYWGNKWEAA